MIVDDDPLVVEALRHFLESAPDLIVVASAADGQEAVEKAGDMCPDVLLMDMQMPRLNGIEATRWLTDNLPDIRVLALSSFATDRYVVHALRAGASGYLVKDAAPEHLAEAVRRTAAGQETISPEVLVHVVREIRDDTAEHRATPAAAAFISPREHDVINLLARGLSNREIASELDLSEATVKSHLARIMAKLGVRDRVQTVIRAYEWGLAELGLPD